ncbi:MAG: glycine betaine ABC transporter substrate-binding protein [Pseudomonadales bacterium]
MCGAVLLSVANPAAAHCGHIEIAELPWETASLITNIDRLILSEGYDCRVSLVPDTTLEIIESMEAKGRPDIASELWTNNFPTSVSSAIAAGELVMANDSPISGLGEGWWIPAFTAAAHPELKTVRDVIDRPELFADDDDPTKGAFTGCPRGWACSQINMNLFRAFKMRSKGWKLITPKTGEALNSSINKANFSEKNWFGYYWTPTPLIGKHGMVQLDFGAPFAGDDNWDNCVSQEVLKCKKPKPSAWKPADVATLVTAHFKETAGDEVMGYLEKRVFPSKVMNKLLSDMQDSQISSSDMAAVFMSKYEDLWTTWVSDVVAKKIQAKIN